jgi:hypothetical protein
MRARHFGFELPRALTPWMVGKLRLLPQEPVDSFLSERFDLKLQPLFGKWKIPWLICWAEDSIIRRTKTDNLILVLNRPIIPENNQ